jgi:6-phospho-beta-glucosidase
MRMSMLGGSSPFTLGLFTALADQPCAEIREVVLYGRDHATMALVAHFAASRLPAVTVRCTTDLEEACDSFDVVLHQIRYGGLEGRAEDEAVALAQGAIPDETIGPAGLNAAYRLQAPFTAIATKVAASSPNGHFINLTNPLSLSTSLARSAGVLNPIGICELPTTTAAGLATLIGVTASELSWDYAGLNHRGFLYNLEVHGEDVLPLLLQRADRDFGGLDVSEVAALGGIPTKYFRIFSRREPVSPPGRASALGALRRRVAEELARNPDALPPSLAERDQSWWSEAVIPLLHALLGSGAKRQIMNLVGDDGLTREGWCRVSSTGVTWIGSPRPPVAIANWIDRFEREEQDSLGALFAPRRLGAKNDVRDGGVTATA